MAPTAVEPKPSLPISPKKAPQPTQLTRLSALDPTTTTAAIAAVIAHDGGVIITNFITRAHAARIKTELGPIFDADIGDKSGFFPDSTQRATGLIGKSPACVEMLTVPLVIDVANAVLSSTYTQWLGEREKTVTTKPILSSTAGFRVNPGGENQVLHRDDADYHTTNAEMPVLLGCVAALTKTTKENGATRVIPGSHKWGPERPPHEHEAVYAELDIGDTLIFVGNLYHGGSANYTKDEARETVGMFYNKGYYRPAENQMLEVPPQKAAQLTPQVQRLLGYGISRPGVGFYQYQDPMRVLFKVEDEETVNM